MSEIVQADNTSLARAAKMLREGSLVAFPTETVYGLGGNATDDRAVAAIFTAKGRPQFNPLIVHVGDLAALDPLIEWNDTARLLADQFWPGPITLVLSRKKDCPVSLLASAGLDTLAVRIPSHPVALQLLRESGLPIAAPSANASGKLSPTTPLHVAESLGDKVGLILAGGKCAIGVESTVVNVLSDPPKILRPGGITKERLLKLLPTIVGENENVETHLSPGQLTSHYAPNLPLRLNADNVSPDEALLAFGPDFFVKGGAARLNLSETGDFEEAAGNLFAMLRQLDKQEYSGIAVTPIAMQGLGVAINDRLKRASQR